jgi:hypothetical protein
MFCIIRVPPLRKNGPWGDKLTHSLPQYNIGLLTRRLHVLGG